LLPVLIILFDLPQHAFHGIDQLHQGLHDNLRVYSRNLPKVRAERLLCCVIA
jgi:hypothetical protein